MVKRSVSPFRVFFGVFGFILAVYVALTLFPMLSVTPATTTDPRAAFGMMFNLKNGGVAAIRDLSSTVCVNNYTVPGSKESGAGGVTNYASVDQSVGLSDLEHGDTVSLPFGNLEPGPTGTKADLVFVIRYQPGWWFWHDEKRFRFSGTETAEKQWVWKAMTMGGPCS